VFFHRADGDAEPVGDFLVERGSRSAEQQDGAAALGELGDGLLELLHSCRAMTCWTTPGVGEAMRSVSRRPSAKGAMRRRLRAVEGSRRAVGVEQGLGFFRRLFLDHRVDAEVGVMGDSWASAGCQGSGPGAGARVPPISG